MYIYKQIYKQTDRQTDKNREDKTKAVSSSIYKVILFLLLVVTSVAVYLLQMMKEWADARERVQEVKAKDAEEGEKMSKEITSVCIPSVLRFRLYFNT